MEAAPVMPIGAVGEPLPIAVPPTQTTVIIRQAQPVPPSYLAFSILVTIFCCPILGIVALVKSSAVRSRYDTGDLAGSQRASMEARKWAKAGLITGIVINLAWIIFVIVYYVVIIAAFTTAISSY